MTTTRGQRYNPDAPKGMCTDCGLRPIDRSVTGPLLCGVCLDYADHDVTHMDNTADEAHADMGTTDQTCPVCNPEMDERYKPIVKKTRNVVAPVKQTTHRSHKGCGHVLTPAARAVCRANGGPASA